jgi:hypothetical protein
METFNCLNSNRKRKRTCRWVYGEGKEREWGRKSKKGPRERGLVRGHQVVVTITVRGPVFSFSLSFFIFIRRTQKSTNRKSYFFFLFFIQIFLYLFIYSFTKSNYINIIKIFYMARWCCYKIIYIWYLYKNMFILFCFCWKKNK